VSLGHAVPATKGAARIRPVAARAATRGFEKAGARD
jgi:hypothetical protein